MPHLATDDNVELYYEDVGSGTPIVFVHEFAGDYRSWEPQLRFFARRYRCIAYNARGYPPSGVPAPGAGYSQARAAADIRCVLDGLKIDKAHVVGLSMGGFAVLHFGLNYPERARSLLVGGAGYGSEPGERDKFRTEASTIAARLERDGMAKFAEAYAYGPTRVQFERKDPRGFAEFKQMLAEHSAAGAIGTQLGVQRERPSLFDLEAGIKALNVPMLVVTGDEDWPCLLPNIFLKRTCASAALLVLPNCGHAVNLEEPGLFNAALADFFAQVDAGRWPVRDPRAISQSITGMTK
ncbi:MAG TPA: alpha/beta hydrolase [Hyphomicrobiaceae bacterium]|nr:alpha/beta hydrolase [Hyphomicrobiaceae bacterium]